MNITLVNIGFPTHLPDGSYYYVPVGILSLSSFLEMKNNENEEPQYKIQILDYQLCEDDNPETPQSLIRFLEQAEGDTVGIGCMAKDLPLVLIATQQFKQKYPHKTLILGGPGPTGVAKKLMENFPWIDMVIMGEGEHPLSEVGSRSSEGGWEAHEKGEKVSQKSPSQRGNEKENPENLHPEGERREAENPWEQMGSLVYRWQGKVIQNSPCPRIEHIDELPFPAYHLINKHKYNYIYIPGTRGCSHYCTFCDQPALWRGREIARSIDSIYKEIEYIQKNIKARWGIAFSDNEFCRDKERFEEFYQKYKNVKYRFPFSMDRRIDHLDEETLKKAISINNRLILFGIESGSDRVLKELRKGFTSQDIIPGLLMSSRYVENSIVSLMFNYPFETLEDFIDTLNIIYYLWNKESGNFLTFQIHYLSPLPRTPIYERYKDKLILRPVSNIMTSGKNLEVYRNLVDLKKKRVLLYPRSFDDFNLDHRIKELIVKYPDIFPSFYIYDSPDLEIKEKLIKILVKILEEGKRNVIYKNKNFNFFFSEDKIFFGTDLDFKNKKVFINYDKEIKATHSLSPPEEQPIGHVFLPPADKTITPDSPHCQDKERGIPGNSLFMGLDMEIIENPSSFYDFITPFLHKKLFLYIKKETIPLERSSGDKIYQFLQKFRLHHPDFRLISSIPREIMSFSTSLRMIKDFIPPEEDIPLINI